jgi:Holliday junction resolvase RusA-like endonuclease
MTLPPLEPPRILLHVRIPGEPVAQMRAKAGGSRFNKKMRLIPRFYDPNEKDKEDFQWQIKAAVPTLRPVVRTRLGIFIEIWSAKPPVQKRINRKPTGEFRYVTDWDNYGKFYCDALKGMAWDDDCWIEDGRVVLHRQALEPAVKIMVWELPPMGL